MSTRAVLTEIDIVCTPTSTPKNMNLFACLYPRLLLVLLTMLTYMSINPHHRPCTWRLQYPLPGIYLKLQ